MASSLPETAVLDRVEAFMRSHVGPAEQGDVVAAFAGTHLAAQVRLSLQDLRKRGKLDHTVDSGQVFYIWVEPPPPKGAAPLRQTAAFKTSRSAPATLREKIISAMQDLKAETYTLDDIWRAVGGSKSGVKKALKQLVGEEKAFGAGSTVARRYSLKPIVEAPKARDADRLPPPFGTVTADRLRRQHHAPAIKPPQHEPQEEQPVPGATTLVASLPTETVYVFAPPGVQPLAAITADRRIVVVNGGRGVAFDADISAAIIDLVRTFDAANLMKAS